MIFKNLLNIFCLLSGLISSGQVTFIVTEFPKGTSENGIFISGDFEGWTGGQDQFKLTKENNKYSITIPNYQKAINYKFTLGNWDKVECKINGNSIENRTFVFNKKTDTVSISIANWSSIMNKNEPRASTASKNVHIFSKNFQIPQLNRTRRVWVYLPPDYTKSKERYPVLYMLDGQNLFDSATSFSGEWEVDEQLNKLSQEKVFNCIVVAIDNGKDKRITEYSAWNNEIYGKAEGEAFLNFLINTLKPEIDNQYRTKPDSSNTVIIGSSMGGLFAHFAALKRPDIFGKAAIFSPSFWYSEECFNFTKKNIGNAENSKLYYLIGGNEDEETFNNLEKMISLMKGQNFPQKNINENIIANGKHNELLWKTGFEDAICWLFSIKH